jgi:hypothetical protein
MRSLAILVLLAGYSAGTAAPTDVRPACSKELAGQFWPDAANRDPELARILSRRGALEICTRTPWRYRWLSPTVSIRQLRRSGTPQSRLK